MTLRCRELERSLRERVKPDDAVQKMPFWQRVGHRLDRVQGIPIWAIRTVFSLILVGAAAVSMPSIRTYPDLWLAGAGLWALALAGGRSGFFRASVSHESPVGRLYRLLWMLPLTADRVFRYRVQELALGAFWLLAEFLVLYAIIASGSAHPLGNCAGAVCCAAAQAAFLVALTWLFVAVGLGADWLVWLVVVVFGFGWLCSVMPRHALLLARIMSVCNPAAWINVLLLDGWIRHNPLAWWAAAPVAAVFLSLPFTVATARRLNSGGLPGRLPRQAPPTGDVELSLRLPFFRKARPALPPLVTEAEQRERILGANLLGPTRLGRFAFAERLVLGLLAPRERHIVEAHWSRVPPWSGHLLGFMVYFALYFVANTQLHYRSFDEMLRVVWTVGPGSLDAAAVVASIATAIFSVLLISKAVLLFMRPNPPEAFQLDRHGQTIGYRACRLLPLNHWEVARVLTKVNAVFFLLLLPFAFGLWLSPACQMATPERAPRLFFFPKWLVLLCAISAMQPTFRLMTALPRGFADWRLVVRVVLCLGVVVVLAGATAASATLLTDCLLMVACVVICLGQLVYYGARYNRKSVFWAAADLFDR